MAHSSSPKRWTHTHTNFCAILMHPNFAAQPEAAQRNRDKNKSRFKENKYIKKTFVWQHKTHNGMQVCYNRCKYKNTHTHYTIARIRKYRWRKKDKKSRANGFSMAMQSMELFHTCKRMNMNAAQYRIKNESKANKEKQDDRWRTQLPSLWKFVSAK